MKKDEFLKEVLKLGISLNDCQLELLDKYYHLLVTWNEKINLTRIIKEEDVYLKHFYDSITLCKVIDLTKNLSLCDIGSGAGFPGLVLKIVFPNLHVTLVDALQKRVNFLELVVSTLGLNDIEVYHDRGEEFAKSHREKFDIVTSRAVASLDILAEISIPMVKIGGYFIPMKSNVEEEIHDSIGILKSLNGKIVSVEKFYLPFENSMRTLIKIVKLDRTNLKYPRNFNKIKKGH